MLMGLAALAVPASAATPSVSVETGNDISFPQCGRILPGGQAFGIVGVNDGLSNTLNPCFGPSSSYPSYTESELYWAVSISTGAMSQPKASLYVNTDDPGNLYNGNLITDWPSSGSTPYGTCTTTVVTTSTGPRTAGADSTACGWKYGEQEAAQDVSWLSAAAAAINGQSPPVTVPTGASGYPWWLDVETSNTWQQGSSGEAMNIAVLQGMVSALSAAGGTSVGAYATSEQWDAITGGTLSGATSLGGMEDWIPGASTLAEAQTDCALGSFTGGIVALAQWTSGGTDSDVVCTTAQTIKAQPITFPSTPPTSPTVGGGYTVTATASSGLTVSFSIDGSSTAGACSINGATVSLKAGTCVIDANQAGNSTYASAPQIQQKMTVTSISRRRPAVF